MNGLKQTKTRVLFRCGALFRRGVNAIPMTRGFKHENHERHENEDEVVRGFGGFGG